MRKRIEIKVPDREAKIIEETANLLQMTKTETIRNALRFGISALIKFETGDKSAWLKIKQATLTSKPATCHSQKDNTPKDKPKEDENYDVDAEMEKLRQWEQDHKS